MKDKNMTGLIVLFYRFENRSEIITRLEAEGASKETILRLQKGGVK